MTVFVIIAVLAVVQSLFGVGLLLFGTPTLLLLGYSFPQTLALLLPASITISLLQVSTTRPPDRQFVWRFAVWCLAPLVLALATVLLFKLSTSLNLAVMLLLVVFVLLRISPSVSGRASTWVAEHDRPWLVLMGVVHGVSNLGGALLVILAASRSGDKEEIRRVVAFCYACFAAIQLAVLAALTRGVFDWRQPVAAVTAAVVFAAIGERLFRSMPVRAFNSFLTLLAAAYAGLLGLRSAGIF